jgi:hypothetical protein
MLLASLYAGIMAITFSTFILELMPCLTSDLSRYVIYIFIANRSIICLLLLGIHI